MHVQYTGVDAKRQNAAAGVKGKGHVRHRNVARPPVPEIADRYDFDFHLWAEIYSSHPDDAHLCRAQTEMSTNQMVYPPPPLAGRGSG
jgi:hypothetical protein